MLNFEFLFKLLQSFKHPINSLLSFCSPGTDPLVTPDFVTAENFLQLPSKLISLFCLQGLHVTVEYITSTSKHRKQTSTFFFIRKIFQAHACSTWNSIDKRERKQSDTDSRLLKWLLLKLFRSKLQIILNVSVSLWCDLQEHLCINNKPTPFSCTAICHLHKEQQQQFAISPQRELFYLCILLSGSEMTHTTQTGTVIFVREAGWF